MIQTKCLNGHYFDCEEYEYCPMCGAVSIEKDKAPDNGKKKHGRKHRTPSDVQAKPVANGIVDETFGVFVSDNNSRMLTQSIAEAGVSDYKNSRVDFNDDFYVQSDPEILEDNIRTASVPVTKKAFPAPTQPNPSGQQQNNKPAQVGLEQQFAQAQARTMGFFYDPSADVRTNPAPQKSGYAANSSANYTEPVVGWLVCVKGAHLGECFNIYSGKSSMGRNPENRIVFSKDMHISRERHAYILYEPKKREFYIQSGESSGLTYLNEENVMGSKKLNAFDIIELGGSQFVFVPLCCDKFAWEKYLGK